MAAEIEDDVTADEGDDWLAGDPVLTFLVETSALVNAAIEVTLLVDGMTVSGRLIDELTYIQRLADYLQHIQDVQPEQPARHDLAAALRDQIRGFHPGAVIGSEYVHLEQVTIARGLGDVTHMALWRGAVEDITGWSVG
jgi:hypothetical protein